MTTLLLPNPFMCKWCLLGTCDPFQIRASKALELEPEHAETINDANTSIVIRGNDKITGNMMVIS